MAFLFASQILCHLHMPGMYTNQQKCNHCPRLLEAVHLYPMVYNRRHWLQILYLHLQHRYNWQNEVHRNYENILAKDYLLPFLSMTSIWIHQLAFYPHRLKTYLCLLQMLHIHYIFQLQLYYLKSLYNI